MTEYFREKEYLSDEKYLISRQYSYCKECGQKIYSLGLGFTISLDPDIIPSIQKSPKSPKWKRPRCCVDCYIRYQAEIGGGFKSGWQKEERINYEQKEKEILEKFRRWESDKTLKELEKPWLEYCIRRYTN